MPSTASSASSRTKRTRRAARTPEVLPTPSTRSDGTPSGCSTTCGCRRCGTSARGGRAAWAATVSLTPCWRGTVHKTDASKKAMVESNTTLFHIPGGLTPKLQPCDGFVNKLFKGNLSKLYDGHIASKDAKRDERGYPEAPSRRLVAQ